MIDVYSLCFKHKQLRACARTHTRRHNAWGAERMEALVSLRRRL